MKYRVAIGRPTTAGSHRAEVANFVSSAWESRFNNPELKDQISEMLDIPVMHFPTDIARNRLVKAAQEHQVDFLFQLDEDCAPPYDFFKSALQFLLKQPTPSIIACPYMSGDGEVQVYRFMPTIRAIRNSTNGRSPGSPR